METAMKDANIRSDSNNIVVRIDQKFMRICFQDNKLFIVLIIVLHFLYYLPVPYYLSCQEENFT